MDLTVLRSQWSDVLDYLERQDRMAWIAFFDARLAKLDGSRLHLDFSDSQKFSGNLEYENIRSHHKAALQDAIKAVVGLDLQVVDGT
jgi:glycerol dehydrogenase-like iron-containing ADH family enzyme